MLSYALNRVRDRQIAEDAVQECLISAWKARERFRGESSERTWLISILRNKLADHWRSAERNRERTADVEPDELVDAQFDRTDHWLKKPAGWECDPHLLLENKEFWLAVRHCLGGLPERQSQALMLRSMDGLSAEDTCKELGVTLTNLWVLLHRARGRMRLCLDETWFDAGAKS